MPRRTKSQYYAANREYMRRKLRDDPAYRARHNQYKRERYAARTRLLRHMQIVEGCQKCGCRDADILCWHHVNPDEKDTEISKLRLGSWSRLMDELDKCIVLCDLCHIDEHQDDYSDWANRRWAAS